MLIKEFAHDKCRRPCRSRVLLLHRCANRAAVVIRQHDYRTALQFWIKTPFTGTVKIIAVHKPIHNVELSLHLPVFCSNPWTLSAQPSAPSSLHFANLCVSVMIQVTTPQTCMSISSLIFISGYTICRDQPADMFIFRRNLTVNSPLRTGNHNIAIHRCQ